MQELVAECNGTYFNTVKAICKSKVDKATLVSYRVLHLSLQYVLENRCISFFLFKFNKIQVLEDLNEFNILKPCYRGPEDDITTSTALLPESFRELGITERPLPVRKRMLGRTWPLRSRVRDGIIRTLPELLQRGSAKCKVSSQFTFLIRM